MALGSEEATRIVRFCLAGDGWGSAAQEDDACVLNVVVNNIARAYPFRFEAASFEEALRQAVDAGVLKASSVERQIAFLGRTPPREVERSAMELPPSVGQFQFPEAATILSALVHETQRERGLSSFYTAAGGRSLGDELSAQWQATDRRRRELLLFRERSGDRLPSTVVEQIDLAEELLTAVAASRPRVEQLVMRPKELIAAYSQMNCEFLRAVDSLLVTMADRLQRPTALAWIALLHAKEKTGIERAQLVSAFVRDRYFAGQYESLLGLVAARASYLHLFAAAAPPDAEHMMRQSLESSSANAVKQMELIALARRRGGFGVNPTDWFAAVSAQMDLLSGVESAIRNNLVQPRA